MYSGWSPFLRVKFWKKEFVGRGVERRVCEKKREGSGRTVDWVLGKRNGLFGGFIGCGGDGGGMMMGSGCGDGL